MPPREVVATAATVTATSSRLAKVEALADLLRRLPAEEVAPTVGFLVGRARQGRVGVGCPTVASLTAEPARAEPHGGRPRPPLEDLLATGPGRPPAATTSSGPSSGATAAEQHFVRRVLVGELRTGALEGVLVDAVARLPRCRPRWSAGPTCSAAARPDRPPRPDRGREALEAVGLAVGTGGPPDARRHRRLPRGGARRARAGSVEWKLDGARIQVHRRGDDVRV